MPPSETRKTKETKETKKTQCSGSVRQDQVQVAELVPEVAGVQRGTVDPLHVRAPGDRLEQNQVRRLRLMESGEQAVDDLDATLRGDDQVCPAARGDGA